MKMMYYKGARPNFGDDLNPWMWPKLLPDFFDDDADTLFIGIGSIIGTQYAKHAKKIVFGSGFAAEYGELPDVSDWDIYFVRGPRTARALNIAPELSLGDSAILLRTLVDLKQKTPEHVSFMPHCGSIPVGSWQQVCDLAGMQMIDPTGATETIIAQLMKTKLLVTEAMHGAIVADAFRIPWIAALPLDCVNRNKWHDWAEALAIDLRFHRLLPSSLKEAKHAYRFRRKLAAIIELADVWPLSPLLQSSTQYIAAKRLVHIADMPPSLSSDGMMESVTVRMLEKLDHLRRDYGKHL